MCGEAMKKSQVFLLNALIMTVTSLAMSSIGVWFNLYISNRLGAVGMGVFQLMMSVYSMATTFAASGINLAATRMVAEETVSKQGNVRGAMRRCIGFSLLFGGLTGLALWFGGPYIGLHWLQNADTVRPLRLMAFSMPFLSVCCALNGYFTAVRRVVKAVASQVLEQFLKIVLTIFALACLVPPGLEYACLAITGAGVLAEAGSCLFELALYLIDRRRYHGSRSPHLTRKLCGIALPVAFSSYLRSGLATVKHLLVPVRLQAGGLAAADSVAVFGAVHGVALPVILFPYAFLNAFNCLIVPELAQSHSLKEDVAGMIDRMFALTLGCSIGICGIVFAFSGGIGAAISENPDVGIYIRLLAPVIPVMYLDTAVDNMLKGLDEQLSVMRYNVIDALFSLAAVWLLLPVLGIKGYILIICGSEVFNFSLSLWRLVKVTQFRLDLFERVVRPVLCIAIAVLLGRLAVEAASLPLSQLRTITAATVSGLAYLLLLRVTCCKPGKIPA